MNISSWSLRLLETEANQEKEEFKKRANAAIEQLKNMGFEEQLVHAAIASAKSLDVQVLVEVLTRKGT